MTIFKKNISFKNLSFLKTILLFSLFCCRFHTTTIVLNNVSICTGVMFLNMMRLEISKRYVDIGSF